MTAARPVWERHELLAWLGDDWTAEQADQIIDEFTTWERTNPDATDQASEAELIAICERIDGSDA